MSFENKKYITMSVDQYINPLLQVFMWQCIEELDVPKDYLQVFECSLSGTKQKIEHSQEEPFYKREYLLSTDTPIFIGKIFVIDDGEHSTMLLAEEY